MVKVAAGKVPIIAGCGSNDTAHAIELTRMAKEVGASAALHVPPYYNRPNQDGIYAHLAAVAEVGREPFRHHSYFSDIAVGCIVGLGALGYELAVRAALERLAGPPVP